NTSPGLSRLFVVSKYCSIPLTGLMNSGVVGISASFALTNSRVVSVLLLYGCTQVRYGWLTKNCSERCPFASRTFSILNSTGCVEPSSHATSVEPLLPRGRYSVSDPFKV